MASTRRPAIGELRRFALNKFNSINIGGGSKNLIYALDFQQTTSDIDRKD
ncbi:16165_t:CDS:2 [Entrophospora sp. SA101]|nr:16165_t:CDS:2 [Entrophospora sp. SA101]